MVCPFHADGDTQGKKLADGSWEYVCDRSGHPHGGEWRWLEVPPPPDGDGLGGFAEEYDLARELPAAVQSLGEGWFEYGLVERAYALARPQEFGEMVERWGHTALADKRYTVSSYLARVLGQLSRDGAVGYHGGVGTGRWSYNSDISFWAARGDIPWDVRTAWVDLMKDTGIKAQSPGDRCLEYVAGADA